MIGRAGFLGGIGSIGVGVAAPIALPNYAAQVAIGVVCPLSGPLRATGESFANGVRAAIDDYNSHRTSFDKVFTLRTFDDRNVVANALVNAQFAIADPTIVAVIGHLGANGTIAAARTYAEAQMPLLAPTVTADGLTALGYRTVFRLPTRDFDEGSLLATFVLQNNAPKKPHVLVQDGDYGADVARGLAQSFNARKVAAKVTVFSYDRPDYAGAADAVIANGSDHVCLAGNATDMAPVVAVLRSKGYTGPFAASQGFFDTIVVTKFAKEADGMIVSTSMPYLPIAPAALRIRADFEGRYGPLAPVPAFTYAAAQIVIAAVRATGAIQRATLARAMSLQSSFSTLVGNFQFGPTGDTIDPELYFYTVRSGAFGYVRQAHPSSFLSR